MGSIASKNKSYYPCEDDIMGLWEKIRLLQEEINETTCNRVNEYRAYEKKARIFAIKDAEWKQERKRLREKVRRLRKKLEEKEEIIQGMEAEKVVGKSSKEWGLLGTDFLAEYMREEQACRDKAVEKWKRLYLAIKTELDTLIQRTHQGERLYQEEKEDIMEALRMELKDKEETIEVLKARIATMEEEGVKKEREVDILRQSLRIMSNKNTETHVTKGLPRSLHL